MQPLGLPLDRARNIPGSVVLDHHRSLLVEPHDVVGLKTSPLANFEPVALLTHLLFDARGLHVDLDFRVLEQTARDGSERGGLLGTSALVDVPHVCLLAMTACQTQAIEFGLAVMTLLNVEGEQSVTVVAR